MPALEQKVDIMVDMPPPSLSRPAALEPQPVPMTTGTVQTGIPIAPVKPSQPGTPVPLTTNPRLFGDWGGVLPRLKRVGLIPTATLVTETAANLNGGTRRDATLVWQINTGLTIDLPALAGLPGTVQVTVTKRDGPSLNQSAGLGFLQFPQGTFGRGRITRLTSAFYQNRFGPLDIKLGRVSPGDDFNAARGDFMSLYLVGSATGHIAPNIWYNFPVSEWGGRIQYSVTAHQSIRAGVYQVTPRNIDVKHGWYLGTGDHRNTGVLIPFEWQRLDPFSKRLPGLIKVGAFYSNLRLPDVVNDVNGNIRQVTGLAAATRRDHTGIFANLRQQLVLPKANGAHAVNIFFNGTWVSRGTPVNERKIAGGISMTGVVAGRPTDELALGVAEGRVNDRITKMQRTLRAAALSTEPVRTSEFMTELYYGVDVMHGLVVRPNVQLWIHPGGDARSPAVVILGMKTVVAI